MKLINRILAGLLIIIIPFAAIAVSTNILTRLPDIYAYEFTKSRVTEEIDLTAKPTELANLFSSYLMGKTKELQLVSEYQGREQQVFTMRDQIGMYNIKEKLDRMLIASVLAFFMGCFLVYWLKRKGEKERVRTASKYGFAFYLLFWMWTLIAQTIGFFGGTLQRLIFGSGFDSESVLGMLLSNGFFQTFMLFNFISASVILFVIGKLIWKFTEERRMFIY